MCLVDLLINYTFIGEVYEVDEKMMSNLDKLEDHPNYYIREIDDIDIKRPYVYIVEYLLYCIPWGINIRNK